MGGDFQTADRSMFGWLTALLIGLLVIGAILVGRYAIRIFAKLFSVD